MRKLILTLLLFLLLFNAKGIGYIGNEPFFEICQQGNFYELDIINYGGQYRKYHATKEDAVNEAQRMFRILTIQSYK